MLTADGSHLFVQRRSDTDTTFELWSLDTAEIVAKLETGGAPALVSHNPSGQRIAIADYDRAVRIWDLRDGSLIVQIDLAAQPSEISLAPGGEVLGTVFGTDGVTLWRIDRHSHPLLEDYSPGRWQLQFSPSGSRVLVGRAERGFQVHDTSDGRALGPSFGSGTASEQRNLLAFSTDEQVAVTGGPGSSTRFWRVPTSPVVDEAGVGDAAGGIWLPSGDAVAMATPDARQLIFGDPGGNVHVVPADIGHDGLLERASELTFYGHNAEVRHLAVSANGALAASIADDNTLRVWTTADGLPRSFITEVQGGPVEQIAFGPSGAHLAVLSGLQLHIYDAGNGAVVTGFDLGEHHATMAFADTGDLYLGSISGALRAVSPGPAGGWTMQALWQGDEGIRWLEAAPGSKSLILVDANDLARLFNLEEARIGERTLQLPGTVDEVVFTPGGLRVLFRTPNWVHIASSSASGLMWLDATLAPRALAGSRIVFGDPEVDEGAVLGNRFFLPVAGDGYPRLAEVRFGGTDSPGLFGNRDELIAEWSKKLALVAPQSPDE